MSAGTRTSSFPCKPLWRSAGVDAGVPLADLGRRVAVLAEGFGPEGTLLRVVGAGGIFARHAHGLDAVRPVAGEHGGARWHAPGAEECAVKADAGGGEVVDV